VIGGWREVTRTLPASGSLDSHRSWESQGPNPTIKVVQPALPVWRPPVAELPGYPMTFASQIKDRATEGTRWLTLSLGLLLLRAGAGGLMIYAHGWDKLSNFSAKAEKFGDPLHLGSTLSLGLVTFAEFFCAAAVILGLFTRVAAIPPVIAMGVAAFLVHLPLVRSGEQVFKDIEFPLLYLVVFLTLVFTGAGKFSLDALIFRRKRKPA
jgi:putative oxidoreductase